MTFGRRKFLWRLALLASFCVFRPRIALSVTQEPTSADKENGDKDQSMAFKTIDFFLKEKADYDMSFLWFKKAAVGSYEFVREGDGYKATLQAETKGFIGFFTSYRKHVYISHLTFLLEKGKLRSDLFERSVIIKDKEDKTITYLDYSTHLMSWKDYKKGELKEEKSEPIPEDIEYEDIISAFANFRMGVFGEIKRGRKFEIYTIPEKGQSVIKLHITSREETIKDKGLYGKDFNEDLIYLKIKVPKEIFKSKTGEVSVWLDRKIIPLKGVVKDYIGFGDIKAVLRREQNLDKAKHS